MSEIIKTTLLTLNESTESLYYLGKNKYSISLSEALTKHQLIIKFTELSVDLLITLGERYLLFVLFRETRIQPLLCLYFQY